MTCTILGMDSTETIIVEVRAAEGGSDAKLLVLDQHSIYARYCALVGL